MAQLAILGGPPLRSRPYPSWPIWDETERDALVATLESGAWWSGDGDRAQTFADDFAAFQGARHGLPMTNGTHTLEAALVALGVGRGDEVIVPAITFVASATAVLAVGAEPVIVDVDADTLCIDSGRGRGRRHASARAPSSPSTAAAAWPTSMRCSSCASGAACASSRTARMPTARPGADAASARWGAFGSFSMQGGKLLTAGEGGVLLTNDEALEDRAWQHHNCGRERGRWFYHHRTAGSNLRMTEWQGAVLSAQLARFRDQHATRNANAVVLNEALAEIPGIRPQPRDERMDANGNYCFIFHYDASAFAGLPLREFEAALEAEGIPMGVSYPSLGDLELFAGDDRPGPAGGGQRGGDDGLAPAPDAARPARVRARRGAGRREGADRRGRARRRAPRPSETWRHAAVELDRARLDPARRRHPAGGPHLAAGRRATSDPVPAILEYLPYRLSDGTATYDHAQMTYFARARLRRRAGRHPRLGQLRRRHHGRVRARRSRPTRSRCCGGSPRSPGATAASA